MATINEIIQSAVDRVKLKGSETWIKWSFWTRAKDVELNSGKNVETAVSELDENISNEIDRATDRENEIETALNSEITRAKSAESTLSTSINNEITRAKNAESTLETNKVPITRTINGKALSSDITLSASDVGADASGSANTALTNAKAYTDTKVADLVNSAPETLDTLGEIADALKDNADIVDVLNESIATKANASDLTSHTGNTTVHITSTERTNWNDANSKKHTHSNKTVLDNTTASYTTADKTKLDGIATSAEVNQNAFSNVVVGSTTIAADSKTDSLTLAGSNVTLTPDATNDKVTIGITKANVTSALGYTPPTTNTTYGVATSSTLGLVKSGTDITVDSYGNVSVNDDSHNHTIANVDNLQTTLDAKASKYEWTAKIKGQTWSRIFQVKTSVSVIGNSGILNVSFTRGNVICNATFMITTSHKNKCFITQLSANNYSPFKIRGVANTHGDAYIELYDYTASISTATEQAVYCRFIPLRVDTVNVYTEFADGTTVPTDYTANDPLTVDITGGSMVASKFVGNADTATKLKTARTISLTGSVTGSGTFDGSGNLSIATTTNHTHNYLPLSGGTLTGNLTMADTKNIMLRTHETYSSGICYDTKGNECISLWAKNAVTRLRWNAGVDMSTMVSGKMMDITPDFEISKASGSAMGYIAGTRIVTNSGTWGIGVTGNAATATKLSTARNIKVNLGSTSAASFDGSGDATVGVTGTLGAGNGGTGKTSLQDSANALINGLATGNSEPQDNDYFVSQYAGGTQNTFHRRPVSALWGYIKGKISSVLGISTSGWKLSGSTANVDTYITAERTDTGVSVAFGVGSGGTNHGLWSHNLDKWMVYGDASNVYLNGDAATATKLKTARTISLTGSVTGSGSFDGSGNLSIATTTNHTHNYAGSSSAGGAATTAVALTTSAGSATQPVYFSGGKPVACTYTLGKSVPSNAVFTDTNTKVTQTVTTSNASYPLLLAPSGQTATATTTSYFDSGVTLNPGTNTIAANISGEARHTPIAYYGSDVANSAGWYKVGTFSLSGFSNMNFNLLVTSGYSREATGILTIDVRCDNTVNCVVRKLKWLVRYGFGEGDFYITTGGNNTWSLYVRQTIAQYGRIQIQLLTQTNTSAARHDIVLENNDTAETTAPTGGVASTDGGIVATAGTCTGNSATATTATKVGTATVGSATQPVYINAGTPTKCTYTLGASVPSGAKFTDTVYTHPTTSGNKHIPSGGSSGQILRWSADGTAVWGNDNNTTYSNFVKSGSGAKAGLVPAPSTTAGTTKYLREDGTWAVPPNTTYTSLKNPYSLTIQGNGTTLTNGTYDGSAAKTVNITPSSIGAAPSSHTHSIANVANLQTTLDGKAVKKELISENLNNVTTPGFYNAGGGNTVTSKPSGMDHFGLYVVKRASGDYYTQILIDSNKKQYRRHCDNGTWSSWVEDKLTDNNTTYSTGTASTAGIGKLYTGTGTATDGSMTQSAITTAINNAKSAAAQTVDINEINESTIMTYYVPFTAIGKAYELKANDGIRYIHQQGSGSSTNGAQIGSAILQLGNSSYSNTSGNKQGILRLYSHLGAYVDLKTEPVSPSASYTLKLPGASGTLATEDKVDTKLSSYLPLAGGTVDYLNISNTAKAKSLLLYLNDGATTVTGMYHSATNEVIYSSSGFNKAYSSHILKIGSSSGSMYGSGTHFDLDTQIRGRYIALEATKAISSSVSIVTSSDEKVKSFTDDIETDEEKLVELFDIIKPKSYNYKYSKADSLSIGFSAQEIEQAMIDLDIDPEKYGILNIQYGHMLSRGDDFEDGKYYTKFYEISYNDLFNLALLKTHMMEKEHVERLVALEEKASKLDELEARLSALENK